jgi:hypothetical protein
MNPVPAPMGVQQFLPAFGYMRDHDVAPVQQGLLSMSLLQAAVQQRRSISSLRLGPNAPTAGHALWRATNPASARMGVQQIPPAFGGSNECYGAPLQQGNSMALLQGGSTAGRASGTGMIAQHTGVPTEGAYDAVSGQPIASACEGSSGFHFNPIWNSMAYFQAGSSAPTAGYSSSGTRVSAPRTGVPTEGASITASGHAASRASSGPTQARRPFESSTGSTFGTSTGRAVGAPTAAGQDSSTASQRAWSASSAGAYSVVHPARLVRVEETGFTASRRQITEPVGASRVPELHPSQQPARAFNEEDIGQFPFGASAVLQHRRVLAASTNTTNSSVLADGATMPPLGRWKKCLCCKGKKAALTYKLPNGEKETLVIATNNVESSELTDHYDVETLRILMEDVDRANGDDELEKAREKVKAFTTRTFSGLLGDGGMMIFMNDSSCRLPLVPKTLEELLANEMEEGYLAIDALPASDANYSSYAGKFRFVLGQATGTKGDNFALTVWACRVCRRYYRVTWNGKFEPVIDENLYALPHLGRLGFTLLHAVNRDDYFDEQFARLPGEITLSVATSILKLAAVVFRRDGAHTELVAPVKILGDVHGEMTTVQKAYSILNDPTVRRGNGSSQFWLR